MFYATIVCLCAPGTWLSIIDAHSDNVVVVVDGDDARDNYNDDNDKMARYMMIGGRHYGSSLGVRV